MIIPRTKNPSINRMINPNINRMINPNINRMINPNINRMINPNINRMINPNINRQINPNINRMINPNINRMLNPNINRQINPNINRMINPNINRNYGGLFIYNMSLTAVEFIVQVNNDFIQIFDNNLVNTRFGVKHQQNGYCIFNLNLTYIGHFESDSSNGFNEFGIYNEWKSIIK